jgi:hypothetical protein
MIRSFEKLALAMSSLDRELLIAMAYICTFILVYLYSDIRVSHVSAAVAMAVLLR